ncbi:MAG: erythromycin esterase family protein [Planctomycetes bacterium]|nr:erythromycin esterase family protein [Planctomycetota bacterium]
MGFEVLAFESGLYECDRANDLLRRGEGGDAMRAGIFGIWCNGIVEGLFDYAAAESRGRNPLLLAGFDCRGSGNLRFELLDRLAAFLEPAGGIAAGDLAALKALEAGMESMGDGYRPESKDLEAGLAAWERVRKALDAGRAALVAKHGAEETEFFSRVLDNWRDREAFERSKTDGSLGRHGSNNLRDGAMARNLEWLARTRFPGKRIVVWGATFHLARGLAGVEMEGNSRYYEGCRNMGQAVSESFGKEVFTLGFAAHGGKGGAFGQEFDVPKPRKGSVEDTLHRYGAPFLFVDLRPEEGPFRRRLRMAPMSYSRDIEAVWPTVLDGVFYVEEMTPAR